MLCHDSEIHMFQIMLKPDLSAASLHAIASELRVIPSHICYVPSPSYSICEDTLVSCCIFDDPLDGPHQYRYGVYTGLTSARISDFISLGLAAKISESLPNICQEYYLSSCPASGRFVFLNRNNSVVVLDFF
jgi:hypothetical protein